MNEDDVLKDDEGEIDEDGLPLDDDIEEVDIKKDPLVEEEDVESLEELEELEDDDEEPYDDITNY
jgi:hypothetical protein